MLREQWLKPKVDEYGDPVVAEILSEDMRNKRYSVLVRPYLLGQFRIQLTDATKPDHGAPKGHGAIVRQCCTYKLGTMVEMLLRLSVDVEPEQMLESLVRPWNCEFPGGRIRLDHEEERFERQVAMHGYDANGSPV